MDAVAASVGDGEEPEERVGSEYGGDVVETTAVVDGVSSRGVLIIGGSFLFAVLDGGESKVSKEEMEGEEDSDETTQKEAKELDESGKECREKWSRV